MSSDLSTERVLAPQSWAGIDDIVIVGHDPIPQRRNPKHRPVDEAHVERLPVSRLGSLPDIEARERHDAPLAIQPHRSIFLGRFDRG